MTLFSYKVAINSGKYEHLKPENRPFYAKLGIIRFIRSFYVHIHFKIITSANPKPSHWPVGVRPSSRRPHQKNAKLFLSSYRPSRLSAGFIRPQIASSNLTQPHSTSLPFSFPSFGVGLIRSLNRPSRSNSLSSLFPHSHPTEDPDSFEELKLDLYLRLSFSFLFKGFPPFFTFLFRFFKGLMREFQRNSLFSFRAF